MNDRLEFIRNDFYYLDASGERHCKDWWRKGLIYFVECSQKARQEKIKKALEKKKELTEKEIERLTEIENSKIKKRQKNNMIAIAASLSLLTIGVVIYTTSKRKTSTILNTN